MGLPQINPPDSLPVWGQYIYVGAFAALATVGWAISYLNKLWSPPPPAEGKHVVMEAASLADMSKFNHLVERVDGMADDTKAIRSMMEEAAEEKEDDERIQGIVDKLLQDKIADRPQMRRRRKPPGA